MLTRACHACHHALQNNSVSTLQIYKKGLRLLYVVVKYNYNIQQGAMVTGAHHQDKA